MESKHTFMVTIHANNPDSFADSWGKAQEHLLILMREQRLGHMHLAADWRTAWLLLTAKDQQEALALLRPIPFGDVIFEFNALQGE